MSDDQPEIDGIRPHDLPPRWDGAPVRWGPWGPTPWTTLVFHDPTHGACEGCGSLAPKLQARGMVTTESTVHVLHAVRLTVNRCPDCRLDSVVEVDADGEIHVWTLDLSDYQDAGSVTPPPGPPEPVSRVRPARSTPTVEESIRKARQAIRRADTPLG